MYMALQEYLCKSKARLSTPIVCNH